MNKDAATSYVLGLNPKKYHFGLEHLQLFLKKAGNPQDQFPSIIVGGTNGKGSTVHFISRILEDAGYTVGCFTSPFLDNFNERIAVNKKNISAAELTELVVETKKQMEQFNLSLSFFEFITVLAFKHFSQKRVDVAVLEVGLGGKLDATNVCKNVLASAITNVSLEHTEWLGTTIKKIASEKAGIIKEGKIVCTTATNPSALETITKEAREKGARLVLFKKDFVAKRTGSGMQNQKFLFSFKNGPAEEFEIALLGKHQVNNAALALSVIFALNKQVPVSRKAICQGLKKTLVAGRFETCARHPITIFDACHNPAGTRAFAATIQELFSKKKAVVVFGCSEEKKVAGMLKHLKPITAKLIVTRAKYRGMSTKKIVSVAQKKGIENIDVAESVEEALRRARSDATALVCVCGSIFVLSEARKALKGC